jgi:hypothetical protein
MDVLIIYAFLFGVLYLGWCDFWQLIRISSVSASTRSFVRLPPTMQPSSPGLWSWDKATILPMEKSKFTETEKGKIGKVQSEEHAHFLWHKEFILACQTVNSAYYCDILWRLYENVWGLCHKLWRQRIWLLDHDNTPPLASFLTRDLLTKSQHDCRPPPTLLTSLGPLQLFFCFRNWR